VKKKINIHDVKQALLDQRFRSSLPDELQEDVQKFLKNPGCACNHPIYMRVMQRARPQLVEYFPTRETPTEEEAQKDFEKLTKNNWQVINCTIQDLSSELKKLSKGRKQIDIARYQDQVTVVVNHLEEIF
jgi:hypothetical protein